MDNYNCYTIKLKLISKEVSYLLLCKLDRLGFIQRNPINKTKCIKIEKATRRKKRRRETKGILCDENLTLLTEEFYEIQLFSLMRCCRYTILVDEL